jgi:CHAT domain-containing protein
VDTPIEITTSGVGLTAIAGNNITFNEKLKTTGGNIILDAGGDITLPPNPAEGFAVDTTSNGENAGNISIESKKSINGANSTLWASSIKSGNTTAGNGGAIKLNAEQGSIKLDEIHSYSQTCPASGCPKSYYLGNKTPGEIVTGKGGDIALTAGGNIIVSGPVAAYTISYVGSTGDAGNISFLAKGGSISVPLVNSFSQTSSGVAGRAGKISMTANKDISVVYGGTEQYPPGLFSFSKSFNGSSSPGGNIQLTAGGNIRAGIIRAQSEQEGTGTVDVGGTIDIRANSFQGVKEENGISILTDGKVGGGAITIQHKGDFFSVGSPSPKNGTVGMISSGQTKIQKGDYPGDYQSGNIRITSVPILDPCLSGTEGCQTADPVIISPNLPIVKTTLPRITSPEKEELSMISNLEERFTSEYEQFLGVKASEPMSLKQIQQRLREIDETTGTHNALVYVFFKEKQAIWEWLTCRPKKKTDPPPKKCPPLTKEEIEDPKKRTAGKAAEPSDEDTLGISLVTSDNNQEISIPFVDKSTGCPILYTDLLNKKIKEKLQHIDLYDIEGKKCPSLNELMTTKWEVLTNKAVDRRTFISAVKDFRNKIGAAQPEYVNSAQNLYRYLINPIKYLLPTQNNVHLSFMLDPSIGSFPLTALRNKGRFLIQDFSISLIPSFSLVDSKQSSEVLNNAPLLAMGASKFSDDIDYLDDKDLPLEAEIAVLKEVWCNGRQEKQPCYKNKSRFFSKTEDFTEDKLKPNFRKNTPLVHLTTHGVFAGNELEKSYLYLFRAKIINQEAVATKFTLPELNRLKLDIPPPPPIELLILSACETAISTPELELSFTGAALQARVKSVMATTDKVGVLSSLVLTTKFYEELRYSYRQTADNQQLPLTKAQVLRNAQLAMINGEAFIDKKGITLNSMSSDRPIKNLSINLEKSYAMPRKEDLREPWSWSKFILIGNPW